MRLVKRWLVPVLISSCFLLSGCAVFSKIGNAISGIGKTNAAPPAPLVNFQPEFAVKPMWLEQVDDGIGEDNYLQLGPVVDANKVFTADAKGEVVATDPTTGKRIWHINTKAPITSGPVIGNGMVVVATGDARIFAINEANGALLWHANIPNETLAAPAISQGLVLVNTVDGQLCALAADTGQTLWVHAHPVPMLVLRGGSTPQLVGKQVIAGFADGTLAAFDATQGRLLWQQTIATGQGTTAVGQMVDIVANPVVADGVIYVATYQGNIAALRLSDGQILWQQSLSSYTGLVLTPRAVVVTDAQATVSAFDRTTGTILWQQTLLANRVLTAPVLMGNTILVADAEGYVHWLSLADGHFMARVLVGKTQQLLTPPAVLGNDVYVYSSGGKLSRWQVVGG